MTGANGSSTELTSASSSARVAMPPHLLLQNFDAQSELSKIAWEKLGLLQQMQCTHDMVGFLDGASGSRVTLGDIISDIRRAYVDISRASYDLVYHFSSLATMQGMRASHLAKGRISTQAFLKVNCTLLATANKRADRMRKLSGGGRELQSRLEKIKSAVDDFRMAMAGIGSVHVRQDEEYRREMTRIVAEYCLNGFTTGELVATAIAAANSGMSPQSIRISLRARCIPPGLEELGDEKRPKEEVVLVGEEDVFNNETGQERYDLNDEEKSGPWSEDGSPNQRRTSSKSECVQAVHDIWLQIVRLLQIGRNRSDARFQATAILDALSIAQLSTLVQFVRIAVAVMERAVSAVERQSSCIRNLCQGVSGLSEALASWDAQSTSFRSHPGAQVQSIGQEDAQMVQKSWEAIGAASESWLDVLNRQGIAPSLSGED